MEMEPVNAIAKIARVGNEEIIKAKITMVDKSVVHVAARIVAAAAVQAVKLSSSSNFR